jgi:hypothetical protein
MKKYLLIALLFGGVTTSAHAQLKSADEIEHEALLKENAELKAILAKQHKSLAIGPNNEQVIVEFLSCTASKRTKMATLVFRLQDQAPMSAALSLKDFPPLVAKLKELNFEFISAVDSSKPSTKFTTTLLNVPVIWKP